MLANTHSFLERILTALENINTGVLSSAQGEQAGAFAVTYNIVGADWGATFTEDILTPAGVRGSLLSLDLYQVTEEFSGDSTAAQVRVGTSTDTDEYAVDVAIPDTTAVAAALNLAITAGVTAIIPASTTVRITGTVSVDAGNKEGIGTLGVTILYFT